MHQRTSLACDACRERKIKCDSDKKPAGEPCSKCASAEIQCTFTYKRKKRRPKIAMSQPANVFELAQALIEEVLSSPDSYIPPTDSTTIRNIIVSIAKYARSMEETLARSQKVAAGDSRPSSSSPPHQPSHTSEDEYSTDGDDDVHENFKQLSIGHSGARYFGKSSNFRFVYDALNLGKGKKPLNLSRVKRPEYWGLDIWQLQPSNLFTPMFIFPENDLLWQLIHIFFTEVSVIIPVLHRPTFERAINSGWHLLDHKFGAIVLTVCAIGALYSDDPRVLVQDTKLTSGWTWFRQVRLVRSNFIEPTSVNELQLFCLAYIYLRQNNMYDSAWPLVGLGLRLAVERGIHCLKTGNSRTMESELCIRAFWILRSFDVVQGLTMGRPPGITSEDCDLDGVAECDDAYWDQTPHNEAFTQPVGTVSLLSFFTHYLKLIEIAASVQRLIYCVNEKGVSRQKVAKELNSALNDWLPSVPEHLRWDPHRTNIIHLHQSVILHITYYWVQLQLHKTFAVRKGSTLQQSFASLAICANAARSTVRIGQVLHLRSSKNIAEVAVRNVKILDCKLNLLQVPMVQAQTILLLILWKHKLGLDSGFSVDIKNVVSNVTLTFELLALAEVKSQNIGRIRDKWLAFTLAEGLLPDMTTLPTSTSKRAREDEGPDDELYPGLNVDPSELQPAFLAESGTGSYAMNQPVDFGQASGSDPFLQLGSLDFASSWTSPDGSLIGFSNPQGQFAPDNILLGPSGSANESFDGPLVYGGDALQGSSTDLFTNEAAYQASGIDHGLSAPSSDAIHDERTQYDWEGFMKNIDEALLSVGLNQGPKDDD